MLSNITILVVYPFKYNSPNPKVKDTIQQLSSMEMIIGRVALAKQRDNRSGSIFPPVHLSIRPFVCTHYQSKVFYNQWVYADNRADMVDRDQLLICCRPKGIYRNSWPEEG